MARTPADLSSAPHGPLAQNVQAVLELERAAVRGRTRLERIADQVCSLLGSTTSAVIHMLWFSVWVGVNVGRLGRVEPFDPFPFSFLTLVVSLEAIFLTIFVLISQNHATRQADRRMHLLLQIALLAEQESTKTLELLQRIAERLGPGPPVESDARHLARETDLREVIRAVDQAMPSG